LSSNPDSKKIISYKDAGVDIIAGDQLIEKIKPFAKKTMRNGVLGGLGGFGSMFEIPKNYKNPVLVSGTDGVGTKLKLAFETNNHKTIGQDLVAMCVNDILVQGAEPLFFLDYYACGKLSVSQATDVIKGIADGCQIAGCALVGGETAEMPGMYNEGEYDLAGFSVGIVEKQNIIDGSKVKSGDTVIGLPSTGPHSNGYSLIRRLLKETKTNLNDSFDDKTFADVLLAPTKIYVKPLLNLIKKLEVKALAHITGGGLTENIPRVLPPHLAVEINLSSWQKPNIFSWLQTAGNLTDQEMLKTFNCGIGMILILSQENKVQAFEILKLMDQESIELGMVSQREKDDPQVKFC
jgi:phosphoribosylformylglycinamidine cyclo-ligase